MPKITQKRYDQRKKLIMDTAFELFAENGYCRTSMRDIIASSGISKGGIYTYFKSKGDIMMELVKDNDQRRGALAEIEDDDIPADVLLKEYLEVRLKRLQLEKTKKWGRILFEFWSFPNEISNIEEISRQRVNQAKKEIMSFISKGIDEGIFHVEDTESAAMLIITSINGVGVLSSSLDVEYDLNTLELLIDMHLDSLKKKR